MLTVERSSASASKQCHRGRLSGVEGKCSQMSTGSQASGLHRRFVGVEW